MTHKRQPIITTNTENNTPKDLKKRYQPELMDIPPSPGMQNKIY